MSGYKVFVLDTQVAKIFDLPEVGAPPKLVETVENAFTGKHDRDLGTDAPGRVMQRTGQTGGKGAQRTALQPRATHKQHATEQFARQLAKHIGVAARDKTSHGVVLVAAPRFLAAVRAGLTKTAQKQVVREIPRDLVGLSKLELRRRLTAAMRPMR